MARILIGCALWLLTGWAFAEGPPDETVTFLVTSDPHFRAKDPARNEANRQTVETMNKIPGVPWPERLGGDPIRKPQGVLVLGDLIDDGDKRDETRPQWEQFVKHFGLDGTDGLLKHPVYEGWGNHDGPPPGKEKFGFSVQQQIKDRNRLRQDKALVGAVSANGLHYSWDWGGVHFVQLNLYPADKPHPEVRYSPVWHDPQESLAFLAADLKKCVGDSERPVVLGSHYGPDCDWWHAGQMSAFYDVVKAYNVVAWFFGHTGTKVYTWRPEGAEKPLDAINTGQTEKGFFVAQIAAERLRLAYRVKVFKNGQWDGAWGWAHLLDKRLKPGR